VFDKDLISGFNHRQANWEFSTSVQHEVMPGMALDVATSAAPGRTSASPTTSCRAEDFTRFDIVAPPIRPAGRRRLHGPRLLRRGAGKFGQVRNLNALSDDYGTSSRTGTAWTSR
jgi:hypothetical protein